MTLPKNVAELQDENVVFELECIDRMYLNLYVPQLASAPGVAAYFRGDKGHRFASTKEAVAMSERFRRQVLDFAERKATPIIRFEKGMRKDDVMHKRLRKFKAREGVVFIGIAQEKARVPRTIRKRFGEGEGTIPWIDYTTAMVKHYYFYCVDEDFGPFFIKFCSYFPYTGKLCINGHEYLNGQLARRGIEFEALDNGLLRCADPAAAQRIAEAFDEKKIERFFRKWLSVLPHPYPATERKAGFRYRLSVLQAEFSLTQIWDRPRHGREFFEEVIRENIDLGRPETVQLIFARKMRRSTVAGGRCRTRIVTQGVIPSLHVYYKNTHLKQYHKTGGHGAGCVPKPPLTIATTSALAAFWATCPSCARSALRPTAACSRSRKPATTAGSARRPSKPCKARLPLRASAPALCVLATRACRASSPCSCCFASSSKASATGNCGHYLRRCLGWKKATSVRAA